MKTIRFTDLTRPGRACQPDRASGILDPQQILLRKQLVQSRLVDAAHKLSLFQAVADALGQRESRGDDVKQAQREERADPPGVVQIGDADDSSGQGDAKEIPACT